METTLEEFGKVAQRLSRNPLGIIALFIVLIYGIAGLVFGTSSEILQPNERLPLVWFLVLFPCVVLVAFYFLVTLHHTKLYAPQDFPEAEGFFRAMTPNEQKERLEQEIRESESDAVVRGDGNTLAVEMEGAGIFKTVALRQDWVMAEELAFREIESEFGITIQRNVAAGPDQGFDGIFIQQGRLTVIEVKYVRSPRWRQSVEAALKHIQRAAANIKPAQSFILALVTEPLTPKQRESEIAHVRELLALSSLQVELRIYDFVDLKVKYGVVQ
jgi:hypothetical protein